MVSARPERTGGNTKVQGEFMKKIPIILILLAISLLSFFSACGGSSDTHTVRFVQDSYDDVVKIVKDGEDLTDIPEPKPKIGYTVKWEKSEIKNVKKDTVINCVETPKTYTAVFNARGGKLNDFGNTQQTSVNYVYGQDYALPEATKDGYDFGGWSAWKMSYPEQDKSWTYTEIPSAGKWNICNEKDGVCSITMYAVWTYKVVFRQENENDVVLSFKDSAQETTRISEKDIPAPKQAKGYTVSWEGFDINNLNKNTVINAVKTAKRYKVFFDVEKDVTFTGEVKKDESKNVYYSTVEFGSPYFLPIPKKDGYSFVKWTLNGESLVDGVWSIDGSVTLTPVFRIKENTSYKITFVLGNGKKDVEITLNNDERLKFSDVPVLYDDEEYAYVWKINGETVTTEDILALTKDTTVIAARELKTYRIYFDTVYSVNVGGLKYDEQKKMYYSELKYGTETEINIVLPSYSQSENKKFTFIGWEKDGVKTTKIKVVGDTCLTAIWQNSKDDDNWSDNR